MIHLSPIKGGQIKDDLTPRIGQVNDYAVPQIETQQTKERKGPGQMTVLFCFVWTTTPLLYAIVISLEIQLSAYSTLECSSLIV